MKTRMKSIVSPALTALGIVVALIAALGLLSLTPGAVGSRTDTLALPAQASRMQFPISFEANHGQTAAEVDFLARGPGYTVFLTPTGAVLSLKASGPRPATGERQGQTPEATGSLTQVFSVNPKGEGGRSDEQSPVHGESRSPAAALRMEIVEANPQSRPMGRSRLPGLANYFIGRDPEGWRTNVPTFGKVRYEEVYDGIDLVYYGTDQRKLEYDFIVAPGADPGQIALSFDGADKIELDGDGNLHISIAGFADSSNNDNEIIFEKPYSYQEDATGERLEIPSAFVLAENRETTEVSFDLESYDTTRPLTIDPTLVYSSYLGGSDQDLGLDIAVDSLGNAIVTGWTKSLDFPVTVGALQGAIAGSGDIFVTKVSANGATILFSTYIGGTSFDVGASIDLDSANNIYVAGMSQGVFPTTLGALQEASPWGGILFKLNSGGDTLLYSTYIGSGLAASGLAVSSDGFAHVTGGVDIVCIASTQGSMLRGFVAKVNTAGSAAIYSRETDFESFAIAVDSTGNAYLYGYAHDGMTTLNAIQPNFAGPTTPTPSAPTFRGIDGFLEKIGLDGAAIFRTYLGGSEDEIDTTFLSCPKSPASVAVDDSSSSVLLSGATWSSDYPMVKPSFRSISRPELPFPLSTYITKLRQDGSEIVYSTYAAFDPLWAALDVDAVGNAYLGHSSHTELLKLNPSGCRAYDSNLGGPTVPDVIAVAVDSSGGVYLTGITNGNNFPVVNAFQPFLGGLIDAFVSKIEGLPDLVGCNPVSGITGLTPDTAQGGDPGFTLTVTGLDFLPDSVVQWDRQERPTTFISETELQAEILTSDINLNPGGFIPISVSTPAPGGGVSWRVNFLVGAIRPTLASISPASQPAGGADFTLTVQGTDFLNNAKIRWDGINRTTTFVSDTELRATIPDSLIVFEGTAQISVLNPDPNGAGGLSGEMTFTIGPPGDNAVPAITSVSPPNGNIGAASMSLSLTGTGFISGSVGRWDGADRPTTFISDTQVGMVVTSSDLAVGGIHQLTVFNPAPGGGESAPKNFNVVNPAPMLTAISPSNLDAGGGDFTLTVDGADFIGDSVVYWNGGARTTTFVSGGKLTATIPASDVNAGGAAEVTVNTPAPGGGSSNAAMFTVDEFTTAPTAGQPTSATVPAGGSANFGFTIAPSGSFDQPVTFSCTGLPEQSSCSFSPAQVTPGTDPTGVTLTISTTAEGTVVPLTRPAPPTLPLPLGMLAWLTMGLLSLTGLALAARQKQLRPRLAVAALLLLGLVATACGTAAQPLPGTPPGIYTITVNATSGNLTQTLGFTLTVN